MGMNCFWQACINQVYNLSSILNVNRSSFFKYEELCHKEVSVICYGKTKNVGNHRSRENMFCTGVYRAS